MQMVAAAKMRRAQEQVLATRPYTEKAWEILTHLAAQQGADEEAHPLLRVRDEINRAGLVLITADKGLAGSYNHNIIQAASRFVRDVPYPVEIVAVGKRGRDAMWRLKQNIVAEFTDVPAQPRILDVTAIAHTVMDAFVSGHYDVVYVAFTDFINTLRQETAIWQLLPLHALHVAVSAPVSEFRSVQETESTVEYIYEPDPRTILETVLPRFTELQIYQAILESLASEHRPRMLANRHTTDNANELLAHHTMPYNRARQEAITTEMLDIAGGAEALAKARAR